MRILGPKTPQDRRTIRTRRGTRWAPWPLACLTAAGWAALARAAHAQTADPSSAQTLNRWVWVAIAGGMALAVVVEAVFLASVYARSKKWQRARDRAVEDRDLLRSIIDTLPDRVYFKDLESRFLFDNVAHHKHLGVNNLEATIGKTDADFYPRELAARYRADEEEIFKTGRPWINYEEPTRDSQGDERWALSAKIPWCDSSGKIAGLAGISRDITDLKRTREALQKANEELKTKAAELESTNAELSQYAYVVSHDLKAPLRAMRNYADFLAEDLEGSLTGEQQQYLTGIGNAVLRAERLVEDLLALSRVGSQQNAAVEKIDTRSSMTALLQSIGLPQDVLVEWEGDWPVVEAPPSLFNQVFQNLILNAVKFNKSPQKRVNLSCAKVGPKRIQISVTDNGIGIDPRHHNRIFNVFQRLHTSEEYEGTGIGLAIVRKAASLMRGSIQLESAVGKGSTFRVFLPANQDER